MIVRDENPGEAAVISQLITAAFADAEHRDGTEALVVERLRSAGALTASLVAETGGRIVGHVAFSPVTIDGNHHGWFGLGPVAVAHEHRRAGVAAALIETGLARLRHAKARGCVVLGVPAYYRRFGFVAGTGLRLADVPPDCFMALSLGGAIPSGDVTYHTAFNN